MAPEQPPRWPAWFAPVGFLAATAATLVGAGVVQVIAAALGFGDLREPTPLLNQLTVLVQDLMLIAVPVALAFLVARPRPWHFGLRPAPFWRSVRIAALGLGAFFVFAAVYSAIVKPEGRQTVAENLGADDGPLALLFAGVIVIVLAPIAEEFFFRGFFFRALRGRFGLLLAAALDGLVFGAIHFTGRDTLSLLPVLAALGFIFCLVYERAGTLYPVIALHALNNAFALSRVTNENDAICAALGVVTVGGCLLATRLLPGPRPVALA